MAVVLAAGSATRFGATKQLVEVDGLPLVAHAVATAREAGIAAVFVVVGHDAEAVAAAARRGGPVVAVHNPDHAAGQAGSLRAGIRAAMDTDAEVAVVLLGDQPGVQAVTVRAVSAAVSTRPTADAARAEHDDGPSHPVAFARHVWPRLTELTGDRGARDLLADLDVVAVPVTGAAPRDVDRPEDVPSQ